MPIRSCALVVGLAFVAATAHPAISAGGLDCGFVASNAPAQQREEYERCQVAKNKQRLGKYFCYIEYMAGIQHPVKDGLPDIDQNPIVGSIKPVKDKFFLEVEATLAGNICASASPSKLKCDDPSIKMYSMKTNSTDVVIYGLSNNTYSFSSSNGIFVLYGDSHFSSSESIINQYVVEGKCEKIN